MTKTADAPEGDSPAIPQDRTLLLVDDDVPFLTRLARAMEGRGFEVSTASTVREGKDLARTKKPGFAVVDMRLARDPSAPLIHEHWDENVFLESRALGGEPVEQARERAALPASSHA